MLWADPAAQWLLKTPLWLIARPLPWQGSRVQFGRVRGLYMHPRTRMLLKWWDPHMGYGCRLSVYCPEAP